jgi:hypothetical protein
MTDSNKHTPGPWEACDRGDYCDEGIVILGNDMRVAVVNSEDDTDIIAAAPEMYEALKATKRDFLKWAEIRGGIGTYAGAIARIDAALAKAEGKS